MYLSLNWLKNFVDIPKSVSPEKLGELLSLHTVEVEKVERLADKYKNVVVGKILEVKPHPNADRLRLVLVDIGQEKLEIVCGADNIKPGQLVPVALIGAVLPSGLEIKPVEIRGVKSCGMLCAEDELGLGEDHAGIMILDKSPLPPFAKGGKIGQNFSDYLGLSDVVFEVDNKSITHRADLWSHYGLARDISAFLNVKFKIYKSKVDILKAKKITFKFKVKIEDFKLCPRYMAVGLEGIKVAPSPKWMQDRLSACGMRPINNIVDITNYVMLELGQPLHAFDKNFINEIIVRRAKAGEIIETLDGQKRELDKDMLVITDGRKPVAVAGVMGGVDSEINNQTSAVIVESANFNYDSVRKTAQKLSLRTEASMRFEKGLDPNLCELALNRAAELIIEICPGAKIASALIDENKYKLRQGPLELDLIWLNRFIGHEFTSKQVKQILEKLGFSLKARGEKFSVIIPSWRAVHDVSSPEDLAEEVARIYGYNNLKAKLPKIDLALPLVNAPKALERKIKNILSIGAGLCEVYNYSFVGAGELNKLKIDASSAIKLANPLSEDLALLRPSLIAGLLENIKTNQAKEDFISIYEIGSVFLNAPGEINKDNESGEKLLKQEKYLSLALACPSGLPAGRQGRQAGGEAADLFSQLKGIIEYLLSSLNLSAEFEIDGSPATWADKSAAAGIYADKKLIGRLAIAEKNLARAFGLKKTAIIAEINFKELFKLVENKPVKQFREPSKHPEALRDLAFVVNEKILYNNIKIEIEKFSDLIKRVELFDVYQGENLGPEKKSLAFHIIYQTERTLTSEEVDETQGKLVKHLEKELGAKIRDF
ncbi:MAG: phenylalanine--tRNA ligase subunit beta [Patescibacteria group bacterium]|jgi:phenylalanyl-tRNA synthetase beta chain